MAAIVGALRAILSLESAAFTKGLTNAQRSLQQFDKKMKAIGGKLQTVGLVVSAAGAGIAAAMRSQINAADDMSKAAQKFGVPIDQLSRLKYAADLSDVSFESLGTSLGRLSKAMVASPDQFAELGVAIADAQGRMRGADEVMTDLADVFATMPDGAEKTALAIKLFGRSGADLIPLLNGGSQSLADMAAEADRLGVTMNEKFGKDAEQFNDDLSRLTLSLGVMAREAAEALLPALQDIVDRLRSMTSWFADLAPETQAFIGKMAAITVIAGPLLVALGAVVSSLGTVATALRAIAVLALANPIGLAIAAIAAGAALIYANWDEIAAFFEDLWARVSQAASDAWTAVTDAWKGAVVWFENLLTVELPKAFDAAWDAVKAKFLQWVEDFKQLGRDIWKGLADGILGSRDMTDIAIGDAMGGLIGTAEDAVDSHSPSRVFMGIGADIMDGLRIGIEEGAPGVNAAMDGVASTLGEGGLSDAVNETRDSFKDMFSSIIDGSASAGEALSNLLASFADRLFSSGFDALWGAIFPNANGNAFSAGRPMAFANGGIVNSPTAFRMPSGLGLMGEAGPEAIMPLTRVGGKLGVAASGGGGMQVHFTVNAQGASKGVDELIVDALRKATPVIVAQSVSAVGARTKRGHNLGVA